MTDRDGPPADRLADDGDGGTDGTDTAESAGFDTILRAGVAVYNAGEHHAAHDAWEDRWLDLESGTEDERLLHGLIQFTAAVYHARRRNWSGATKLAGSAREYLADLPATYREVDVAGARADLSRLRADPERIERGPPPDLVYDGAVVTPADLDLDEVAVAAGVVAEAVGLDEGVVADAARFARRADDPDGSRLATFLRDLVGDAAHRAVVFDRLGDHVARERREEEDVSGLFDDDGEDGEPAANDDDEPTAGDDDEAGGDDEDPTACDDEP